MRTGLNKHEKTTEITFDEANPMVEIRTHNTGLKKRLTTHAGRYPDLCELTDEDAETGYKSFIVVKGCFCVRLTALYSDERRKAAGPQLKKNSIHAEGFRCKCKVCIYKLFIGKTS